MHSAFGFLFALACTAGAFAQSKDLFQADVEVYNDPNMLGAVAGHIYYNYPGEKQRIDYSIGSTGYSVVSEIFDYANQLRYLYCSSCEAETYRRPAPIYFKETADSNRPASLNLNLPDRITVGSRDCDGWVKANGATDGNVLVVYHSVTDENDVCRVIFNDLAAGVQAGKYIDFTNNAALATNAAELSEFQNWGCPAPQCSVKIDLYLVFDESGSVSSTDFKRQKDFGVEITNAYTIGPDNVQIGLVLFSSSGRVIFHLRNNKDNIINGISSVGQRGGGTCIPCGVQLAHDGITAYSRPGVGRVMIVITDGGNNVDSYRFQSTIDAALADGIITFGVGVGNVVEDEVKALGDNDPNRFFFTIDFASLSKILDSLITETCQELPGNPCGQGCRGFCACGQTCLCPPICKTADICLVGTCTVGSNGNGCNFGQRNCDDNAACTRDTCDSLRGCEHSLISCDDSNQCTDDSCSNITGCRNVVPASKCDDNDPCTLDVCDPASGCDNSQPVQCDLCVASPPENCDSDACTIRACNQSSGIAVCDDVKTTDCNDNNACSDDVCKLPGGCEYTKTNCDDGDVCTIDTCDPNIGCVHTNDTCDDFNECTIDSCVPGQGCVHIKRTCVDGDICTDDLCFSTIGCYYPPRDCSKDPFIAEFQGSCHIAVCKAGSKGCSLEHINGTAIDECGVCDGDGSSCNQENIDESAAIGIGAGFIALIVLGAIAICAAIAFIGGKKGFDVYMRNKGSMFGATASPLYSSGNLTGQSQLYEGEA